MKKRVLHVFTAMNVGGAETMILNLYRTINRDHIQFDFLVHTDEIGYYEEEILSLGGRIFRLPYPSLKAIKSYQNELHKLFSEHKFAAIHSHAHFFSGFILEVAKKTSIPVRIAHSHTTSDGRNTTLFRQLYRSYMKSTILKSATHMVGCSKTACDSLFGNKAQTMVLPNSFPLQDYEDSINNEKRNSESFVIGHVGRFDEVKNHSFFLETFFHLKRDYPHASAILVGDGPEKESILDRIQAYQLQDSVHLLGLRTDVAKIMSSFDLFLFPSLYEGLGNVVIEAQAAGVPCLVSDTVPKEVDLSLNLVSFKSLQEGAESWSKAAEKLVHVERPSWEVRKEKLQEYGYDVEVSAKRLEKIYSGS